MIFPNGFNDELSRSPYHNFLACQRPEVFEQFKSFIKNNKPSLILEIGTCFGGLSKCLFDISQESNCKFITLDICSNITSEQLFKYNIDYRIKDIFNNYTSLDLEFFSEIQNEQLLILCDGGNKIKEFQLLSEHLKPNDIIMCHDFSYDEADFKDHTFWGWSEIQEKDIIKYCSKYNLYYYMMHEWHSLAWGCFKKLY